MNVPFEDDTEHRRSTLLFQLALAKYLDRTGRNAHGLGAQRSELGDLRLILHLRSGQSEEMLA
jgi:hypothetical protein